MEKYGFVYIWYDRKHKRFYIGSHWGYEDDGYVCSSSWMKQAYKHRPNDFKRRILKTNISSIKEKFEIEEKYLQMIKKEELRKRYYNLHNNIHHWSLDKNKHMSIKEKLKANHWSKTVKYIPYNKGKHLTEEHKEKIAKLPQAFKKGQIAWNKGIPRTEEQKKYHSEKVKGQIAWNKGKPMSEEQKLKISMTKRNKSKC